MRQMGRGGAEVVGPAETRPLVLVLDDDVDYRERLAEELEAQGVKVELTSNGNEGLRKAIAHQPELVMIGMSGEGETENLELLPRI
jgi:DNA-binding response OmpR family regulator